MVRRRPRWLEYLRARGGVLWGKRHVSDWPFLPYVYLVDWGLCAVFCCRCDRVGVAGGWGGGVSSAGSGGAADSGWAGSAHCYVEGRGSAGEYRGECGGLRTGLPVGGLVGSRMTLRWRRMGKAQKIVFFEKDSATPLSIVLAVDGSESVLTNERLEKSAPGRSLWIRCCGRRMSSI